MTRPSDNRTIYTVDQLRTIIAPLVRGYGMREARLFGSYARGEATENSDIDVVVDKGPCRHLAVCGLAEDIHRATGKTPDHRATGKTPDVYDISELREGTFRDTVLREAVAL